MYTWYLAPVVLEEGSVQVGSHGRVCCPPGMVAHIGHTEDSPTQCLVGLRPTTTPPGDWTPVAAQDFISTFSSLFGRNPTTSEQYL